MFVREDKCLLGGTRWHRAFGEVFFELRFVDTFSSVLNIALYCTVDPLFWVNKIRLYRFVAHVTEFHCDSGTFIFIDDDVARAAEIGHLYY